MSQLPSAHARVVRPGIGLEFRSTRERADQYRIETRVAHQSRNRLHRVRVVARQRDADLIAAPMRIARERLDVHRIERLTHRAPGNIAAAQPAEPCAWVSWQTAWDTPEEWGRSWSDAGKRYLAREADVAISNTLEAGLGALWHEEPRYIPSHRRGVRARTYYAMKTVFLAQRSDGRLAPAWGRYVANTLNNVIENAWLPPSVTTPEQTLIRSADGFLGRLIGNIYEEFWPDAKRLLHHRRP